MNYSPSPSVAAVPLLCLGDQCAQISLAHRIARAAHDGQFRRDKKTPYFSHPEDVARRLMVRPQKASYVEVSTAYLHDVLEDTKVTAAQLRERGVHPIIVGAVERLTKPVGVEYFAYLDHVATHPVTWSVKLQDILSNLSDAPTKLQLIKYGEALKILGQHYHET